MFPDYEKLVLEFYHWKKSLNVLSSQLIHPTTAKIKGECVLLCKGEIQRKDEKVIRDFCQEWDNAKTCLQNIDNCDVDKFRPLLKVLKKGTGRTDPKNIELLAWLIDFPYRPFVLGKVYPSISEIKAGVGLLKPITDGTIDASSLKEDPPAIEVEEKDMWAVQDSQSHSSPVKPKRKLSKIGIVGVLLVVIAGSGYWWWDPTHPPGYGGCMYWANDHYQPIPCNQKMPNTLVVALDTAKVRSFKKIINFDTVTRQALGHMWYSKINNNVEVFTADGRHPVYIDRRLKPVSEYIFQKYIHRDTASN